MKNTPEYRKEYMRQWHKAHPEYIKTYNARYGAIHRDKKNARQRQYYQENKTKCRATNDAWLKEHPEKSNEYKRKWTRGNSPAAFRRRISNSLRGRISSLIAREYKSGRARDLLGCSVEDFRLYLESKFESGMTWGNYGVVWQIDHIIPCAIFDLTKTDHQRRCFHFSNTQPLFTEENYKKSDTVPDNVQFRLL